MMLPGFTINDATETPKYLQIVDAIVTAVKKGRLQKGQKISSINEFSADYCVARVTVEKAYKKLVDEGIIKSSRGKGFFITLKDLDKKYRVLLLFNKISHYKKEIYNSFIKTLGQNAQVDLKIHHHNVNLLKEFVANNLNHYDYFVVMPHFYEDYNLALEIIKSIPTDRLIILDKKITGIPIKCGAVYQDFENDILGALYESFDLLKRYNKLLMVDSVTIPSPQEKIIGFRKFCMQNQIKYSVLKEINMETNVEKGEAYIVTEDTDLANLIKVCVKRNLRIGKDVGIMAYNETPIKETLLDGITVITTDHQAMGTLAAELILNDSKESIKNKFSLIKRKSL